MGVSGCNRIMAFARVVSTIGSDAAKVLVRRDLVEQVWQHGRIADPAARYLNCTYFQYFLIDANMYLSPEAAFCPAMLARIPLTFILCLDACAVYQEVQRPR